MSEELFGPILPVLDATLDNAISYTTSHGHPLALYLFSNSQAEKERTLKQTRSGGVTINDCIVHNLTQGTPFGGTGASGMGAFHGPYGFLEFTHLRTVADVPKWLDFILKNRYPPYTDKKTSALLKIVRPVQTVSFDRDGNDVRGLAHQARAIIKVLMLGGLLYGIGTNSRALADPLQLGQSMLGLAGRICGKP
jgi:aldehyde dehydrogenase (NAD+)